MKGFYWGTGAVRCGHCGSLGHNITTCKIVDRDARKALQKISSNPSYVCSAHEHAALVEIKRREERKLKPRKPRNPSKCSFCKSTKHKRPSCGELEKFKLKVYQANKNWKRIFTEKANEAGIGVGALIKFDSRTIHTLDFNVDHHKIAMITSYDVSNLNVFCALTDYSDYQSNTTMQVLSGDLSDRISVKYLSRLVGDGLLHEGWWFASPTIPAVVSPMKFEPDTEWLEAEWDEIFDWFFKKINLQEIKTNGLMQFIEEWAEKV